jgi:hypothetical protein
VRAASGWTRPLILSTEGVHAQPVRSSHTKRITVGINMQLPISPPIEKYPFIEMAVQQERIRRYLPAANQSTQKAFEFYLWNCTLCEAFHVSLHFSEILCRNALNRALTLRFGDAWFHNATLMKIMDSRFKDQLVEAVAQERKQHSDRTTAHHVTSSLTFGFWEHLTTKRFERLLWAKGIHAAFPGAPNGQTYSDLQRLIESVRRWRNRIAHHRAIFDKSPTRKHQDALQLMQWACANTSSWVSSISKLPAAVRLRPQ